MQSNSEIIKCSSSLNMIEKADIIHEGKTFEGMGSYLMPNPKTGRLEGILYNGNETKKLNQYNNSSIGYIGSWDGTLKIKAYFTHKWISNFGDTRQAVYFMMDNKPFYGIYYKTNSDIIRVRELKNKDSLPINLDFVTLNK